MCNRHCVCIDRRRGSRREENEAPAGMDDIHEVQEVGSSTAPGGVAIVLARLFPGVAFT